MNTSLCWERQIWTNVYIGNVDLYAGTINQGRACVYNTGTMNDIQMGHDVWLFMETTSGRDIHQIVFKIQGKITGP